MLHRLLGLVLTLAIGWVPIAPPEHVHESEEDGHHEVVVHRHAAAHGGVRHAAVSRSTVPDGTVPDSTAPHSTVQHSDHHRSTIDHDDDPVLIVNAAFTLPSAVFVAAARVVAAIAVLESPPVAVLRTTPDRVEQLIHGPPLAPASLRAPPSSSRL